MAKMHLNFKGLMAPSFTSFNNDNEKTVNLDIIEKYAEHLKKNKVFGVLVNGTTGEGTSLNLNERLKVTEKWKTVCQKLGLTLMVQISGAPFPDVLEMAKQAELLKVDAVLCFPELYFKPKTEEQLVSYLQDIAAHCPSIPLFYYHIPRFTNVDLNMPRFIDLAQKSIHSFCGLKYTSGDLEQGIACLKPTVQIFLGADTILCAALAAGFDSAIMTSLNICPDYSNNIVRAMDSGKIGEAQSQQKELNEKIKGILKKGDWVPDMKRAFNEHYPELHLGTVRKPLN